MGGFQTRPYIQLSTLPDLYEITGAAHLHSTYSDGTRSIPDIAGIADDLGLDFLLFSDHQTLKPKKAGLEGFYGKTLVLIGYETSDILDINHYLIFKTDDLVPGLSAREYTAGAAKLGGLGIIAHPMEKRDSQGTYPPYPWTAWDCDHFDGFEIWNQLSEWMDGLNKWNKLYRFFHPLHSTIAPPADALSKWDELNLGRKVFGIAGIDAHSFEVKVLKFIKVRIFAYKIMLKSLRNHLMLFEPLPRDNFKRAECLIFDALKQGRFFMSNFRRGDAGGSRFWAEAGGAVYQMGDIIPHKDAHLKAKLPAAGEIIVIHNGKEVHWILGDSLDYAVPTPGIYRLEVRNSGHSWIYSNHFWVAD